MIPRLTVAFTLSAALSFGQQAAALSLSVNGQTELTWHRGGPLLLEASAFLWEGDQATLDWPAPVQLTVLNNDGDSQDWAIENLAATSGPALLTESQTASSVWGITSDAAGAIPDGDYILTVQHPVAGSSRRVMLKITSDPGNADDQMLSGRVESRYWEYKGDNDRALATLNSALDNKPGDIAGLSQKADLLDTMGRTEEAIPVLIAALNAFNQQYPGASHPPRELSRRLDQLLAKINPY